MLGPARQPLTQYRRAAVPTALRQRAEISPGRQRLDPSCIQPPFHVNVGVSSSAHRRGRTPEAAPTHKASPYAYRAARTFGPPQSLHFVAVVSRETDQSRQVAAETAHSPLVSASGRPSPASRPPDIASTRCAGQRSRCHPTSHRGAAIRMAGPQHMEPGVRDERCRPGSRISPGRCRAVLMQAPEPCLGGARKTGHHGSHRADVALSQRSTDTAHPSTSRVPSRPASATPPPRNRPVGPSAFTAPTDEPREGRMSKHRRTAV